MKTLESDFKKIINSMLNSFPIDLQTVSEMEPTSMDKIEEMQELEEDDSKEIFSVAIQDRDEVIENLVDINANAAKKQIVAIDSSSVTLANTGTGILAAIKAAVIFEEHVETFGPFIHHITNDNKQKLYNHFMKDVFELEEAKNIPLLYKMPDRIRNFTERLIQRYASSKVENAIILWDGSLGTGKSQFDTPEDLMGKAISLAKERSNDIVAITKKTNLILKSKESIFSVLSEFDTPAIVDLSKKIAVFGSRIYKILGTTFAAKFAPGGIPFRVDVAREIKDKPSSTLLDLMRSTSFYHGYPVELRNAHIYSKITRDEALACQRMIASKYNIPIINVPDIHKVLLSPFG
ncbi:MAG: DNA double-strand break repair nuclease NurA [Nitrosotalea sp.]